MLSKCLFVLLCVCERAFMYTFIYMLLCLPIHTRFYAYLYVHAFMYTYTYTFLCIPICTCFYAYLYYMLLCIPICACIFVPLCINVHVCLRASFLNSSVPVVLWIFVRGLFDWNRPRMLKRERERVWHILSDAARCVFVTKPTEMSLHLLRKTFVWPKTLYLAGWLASKIVTRKFSDLIFAPSNLANERKF